MRDAENDVQNQKSTEKQRCVDSSERKRVVWPELLGWWCYGTERTIMQAYPQNDVECAKVPFAPLRPVDLRPMSASARRASRAGMLDFRARRASPTSGWFRAVHLTQVMNQKYHTVILFVGQPVSRVLPIQDMRPKLEVAAGMRETT